MRNVQDEELVHSLENEAEAELNSDKCLYDGWGNSDRNVPDEMSVEIDGEKAQGEHGEHTGLRGWSNSDRNVQDDEA